MATRQIHNCHENGSKKVVNVLLRSWLAGMLGGGMASTGEMSTCPASIDVWFMRLAVRAHHDIQRSPCPTVRSSISDQFSPSCVSIPFTSYVKPKILLTSVSRSRSYPLQPVGDSTSLNAKGTYVVSRITMWRPRSRL